MKRTERYRIQDLFFVAFVLLFFLLIYLVENFDSQKAVNIGRIVYIPFVLLFGSMGINIHAILERPERQKI